MIKLYKRDKKGIRYWEAWDTNRKVVVHWGNLGENGETREIRLKGEPAEQVIAMESRLRRAEGYEEIPLDDHATVVVQYRTTGWGSLKDLDKRHKVEAILD